MSSINFQPSAQFVYNLGDPIQQTFQRFTYPTSLSQQDFSVTASTAITRAFGSFDSTTRQLTGDFPSTLQQSNTFTQLFPGNNTAFDVNFMFQPAVDIMIQQLAYNIGIGLNVSAYTSGNFNITSVDTILTTFKSPGNQMYQTKINSPFSMTNLTATGNMIAIVQPVFRGPIPCYQGGIVNVEVIVNETTGVGTRQVGVMTFFPFQPNSTTKEILPSGYLLSYSNQPSAGNAVIAPSMSNSPQQPSPQVQYQTVPAPAYRYGVYNKTIYG